MTMPASWTALNSVRMRTMAVNEVYTLAPRRIEHEMEACCATHRARRGDRDVRHDRPAVCASCSDGNTHRHGQGLVGRSTPRRDRQRVEPVASWRRTDDGDRQPGDLPIP